MPKLIEVEIPFESEFVISLPASARFACLQERKGLFYLVYHCSGADEPAYKSLLGFAKSGEEMPERLDGFYYLCAAKHRGEDVYLFGSLQKHH